MKPALQEGAASTGAFVDIHQHILYGLDDGAANRAEMRKMLLAAGENSVAVIIATPHIAPGIKPFSAEVCAARLAEARGMICEHRLPMEMHLGAEVLYTYQTPRFLSEHRIPSLAGSGKVLLEFSQNIDFAELENAVLMTLRCGYVPVLAHIERYDCLMHGKQKLCRLKQRAEVFCQVNCDSILRWGGCSANGTLRHVLKDGLVDFVASDAHHGFQRSCRMQAAYTALCKLVGKTAADRMTLNGMSLEPLFH